jgi:hypothetical protein
MPPSNGAWYEVIKTYAPLSARYLPQTVLELCRAITESYASQLEAHLQAAIDHFHIRVLTMLLSNQPVRHRYRQCSRRDQPES